MCSSDLNEMTRLDACALANAAGERIRAGLNSVPGVDHVRGAGLLLGVALSEGRDANAVAADLLGKGLIVNAVNTSTLRLAPPLTVSVAEIDEAISLIKEAVA